MKSEPARSLVRHELDFFAVPHLGWWLLRSAVVFVTWKKLVRGFARFSLFLESLDLIGVHTYSFLVEYLKGERVFALKCLKGATGGRDIFSITVVQSLFEFTDGG